MDGDQNDVPLVTKFDAAADVAAAAAAAASTSTVAIIGTGKWHKFIRFVSL